MEEKKKVKVVNVKSRKFEKRSNVKTRKFKKRSDAAITLMQIKIDISNAKIGIKESIDVIRMEDTCLGRFFSYTALGFKNGFMPKFSYSFFLFSLTRTEKYVNFIIGFVIYKFKIRLNVSTNCHNS